MLHDYPAFVPDNEFISMHASQSEDQLSAAMLANLKQVFRMTTKHYAELDQLVAATLDAGIQIFDLETGIVSRIEGDQYTVLDVVSPLEVIERGSVFELEGTYCNEVFCSGRVLGFPVVGNLPYMQDHPVYQNLKLEAYLSAPIWIDGVIYGTLNFSSRQPRHHGFSEHERDLITLMAEAIANFVLIRDRENKLQEANKNLKKFVGFVAHDLRNPIGGISSFAALASAPKVAEERRNLALKRISTLSNTALELVHSVLELSALGAGKITPSMDTLRLRDCIAEAISATEELASSKSMTIAYTEFESDTVMADPTLLKQVLINLLMNAIKYSPKESRIQVTHSVEQNAISTSIKNSTQHATADETIADRYKSVGFGLDIASEILSAHASELMIEESELQYCASFQLPAAVNRSNT